jgi:hypothetical protein
MNRLILDMLRRSGILLALMIATALTLGLAAPTFAAAPKGRITAVFEPATGILRVNGDQQNNIITASRDAAGTILINGGTVRITGGRSTVANTSLIEMSATRSASTRPAAPCLARTSSAAPATTP